MTALYFDATYLCKLRWPEPGSSGVAACAAGDICLLPLTEAIVDRVETVFRMAPASSFLRAADAVHLAGAAEHGFTEIHSNDRHLLAAAPLFGLRGVNVIA